MISHKSQSILNW